MSNNIDNLFNNMGLSDQEISYYKNQYKNIQTDFINKRFDFNRLKSDSQYINVLKEYLKYNGYGYLFKTISNLSSDDKGDSIKLAKFLIDSNLIHKPNIKRNCEIENKKIIKYKQEFGSMEKFSVNYINNNFPFKIKDIDYSNKDYINCEITASNNITININIEKDKEVNFTEVIVIYTSYGIDKLEFSIKCDKNLKSLIDLKNFDEFIEICNFDYDKAFKTYKDERFREWLKKKRYVTQVINYDQALDISTMVSNKSFEVFCAFNQTYPVKLYNLNEKEIIDNNNIPREDEQREIAAVEKENEQKEILNRVEEKNHDVIITTENTSKENQKDIMNSEEVKEDTREQLNEKDIEEKTGMIRSLFNFIKNIFYK